MTGQEIQAGFYAFEARNHESSGRLPVFVRPELGEPMGSPLVSVLANKGVNFVPKIQICILNVKPSQIFF